MRVVRHWHRLPRGGRCPIPGNIQGQVGWGSAAWSSWRCPCSLQGDWTRWPLRSLPTQTTLWLPSPPYKKY